jgi:hypothetical protein
MNNELKRFKNKDSDQIKEKCRNLSQGTKEEHKNLSHGTRFQDRYFKPRLPKHKQKS